MQWRRLGPSEQIARLIGGRRFARAEVCMLQGSRQAGHTAWTLWPADSGLSWGRAVFAGQCLALCAPAHNICLLQSDTLPCKQSHRVVLLAPNLIKQLLDNTQTATQAMTPAPCHRAGLAACRLHGLRWPACTQRRPDCRRSCRQQQPSVLGHREIDWHWWLPTAQTYLSDLVEQE